MFKITFNTLLGYIGTATSEGMKRRVVISDIPYQDVNTHVH